MQIGESIRQKVESFGHQAIGLHLYLDNVQYHIKNTNSEMPKNKKQRLIEFIETYYKNPTEIEKKQKTNGL